MNKTERPTRSLLGARRPIIALSKRRAEGEGRGEKLSLYPLKLVHFLRNETGGGKGREEGDRMVGSGIADGWMVAGGEKCLERRR